MNIDLIAGARPNFMKIAPIVHAITKASNKGENISFLHADAAKLSHHFKNKFDYSTTSYVIHEMPYEARLLVLKSMREICDEIIIGDYLVPQPKNKRGFSNRIAEFLAGKDHFTNYLNFAKHNGLYGLVETLGMEILQEKIGVHGTSHIIRIR